MLKNIVNAVGNWVAKRSPTGTKLTGNSLPCFQVTEPKLPSSMVVHAKHKQSERIGIAQRIPTNIALNIGTPKYPNWILA